MMPRNVALFAALRVGLRPADVHTILANGRRRQIIRELAESDRTDHRGETVLEITNLAEAIAADEHDVDRAALTTQQRRRVYITIVQTHAPLLDTYGVVTYHDRPQKVQAKSDVEALAQILEYVDVVCERRAS